MPENFTQDELDNIWSSQGLVPQLFPKYYSMGPVALTVDGAPSGAAGAVAILTKELSNFPHILYGVRISTTYTLPTTIIGEPVAPGIPATADDVRAQLDHYARLRSMDTQQTVTINLSQQNITGQAMLQGQLCGETGTVWHPFPAPYPMAGGNNVNVEVRRATSYPPYPWRSQEVLDGEAGPRELIDVRPVVFATLLAAEFKATRQSVATHRRLGPV